MTDAYQTIGLEAEAGVATLTLNRPEAMNAWTPRMASEIDRALRRCDADDEVRAVVITGAGRAFCSGGDVEDIIGALFSKDRRGLHEFTRMTCDLILNIRACRRPVIAALNGTVAGAGAVIATACDFRIAAESAKIAYLFVRVGLSGADMGASWLLPRIVGLARATELLMTGDFIDAATAERIGLYHRVVPQDRVLAEATALAVRLARGASPALAITKQALNAEAHLDFEEALAYEARVQGDLMEHPNFREAYEAFRAKREPRFT